MLGYDVQPCQRHFRGIKIRCVNILHHGFYTRMADKFENISDEIVEELIEGATPKNTKKATAWGVSVSIRLSFCCIVRVLLSCHK